MAIFKGVMIAFLALAVCVGGIYSAMSHSLIVIKGDVESASLNGRKLGFSEGSSFVLFTILGDQTLIVQYDSGVVREILLKPRWGDDNSSSIEVSETDVIRYGDVEFEVIQ